METYSNGDRRNFDPQIDKSVNITEIFEERHANRAILAVVLALENYMPTYSSDCTGFYTPNYYWVRLGPIPLSKALKQTLENKFTTNNGDKLLFKNFEQMASEYPNVISYFKLEKGAFCSFVGLPLPEEDFVADITDANGDSEDS